MADEPIQGQEPAPSGNADAVVTRPDYIPETIWDAEKNAPTIDLAATLTEAETLRTAAAERAALIPASKDEYKFDLPEGVELPNGYKWEADPKDPIVAGFRDLAADLNLTQPEVQKLVAFEARRQAEGVKAQAAFDAEQTKQLGANAEGRRTAAKTWMDSTLTPTQVQVFSTLLDYKDGVEAIEALIAKSGGVQISGNPGAQPINVNADLADQAGKPGGGAAMLRAANARKN